MKEWQLNLEKSLKRLNVDFLECLFLHNEKDINKKGSYLLNGQKKQNSRINKKLWGFNL